MSKKTAVLVFGGVSSEHEISRLSAACWAKSLDRSKFDLIYLGITKQGQWLLFEGDADAIADGSWENGAVTPCILSPDRVHHGLVVLGEQPRTIHVDVVLPILHGKNGEDGTIQGLLELSGIPYVGCGVLAAACCMDKAVTNTLLDAAGIARCEWDWAWAEDAIADFDAFAERLEKALHYPIFVKPANAGSSVGISKAADKQELKQAIEVAAKEDRKIVFERFVQGQEIECAVIGNHSPSSTLPGEILASQDFYTYDDKYVCGTSRTQIPANLSQEMLEQVQQQAVKAYKALGCEGLTRVDFFVEKETGAIFINELNTLPGFTAISMYPQLMAHYGTPLPQLLERLIALAMERAAKHNG